MNTLHTIAHAFAQSAISETSSNVSKQQLVNDYVLTTFEGQDDKAAILKATSEVSEIVGTIIDETTSAGKEAKRAGVRGFTTRLNRALVKFGQDNKQTTAHKVLVKTTGGTVILTWEEQELYYDKDEEGNELRDKPMTKAAHNKKHGSPSEGAEAGANEVPLAQGEHEGVRYIATTQGVADLINTLCKLHKLSVDEVVAHLLPAPKLEEAPKDIGDCFTLPAFPAALDTDVQDAQWLAFYEAGKGTGTNGKLTKADVISLSTAL